MTHITPRGGLVRTAMTIFISAGNAAMCRTDTASFGRWAQDPTLVTLPLLGQELIFASPAPESRRI